MGFDADVLIAGGSVAGVATALHLAKMGLTVQIFDRETFPREKVCGEGLMPHGVRALTQLGLLQTLADKYYKTFKGIEYIIDGDTRARGDFPAIPGGFQLGMGIRRWHLDSALLEMARAHPNITVHESTHVDKVIIEDGRAIGLHTRSGQYRCGLVIGADGRGSLVRNQLGLTAPPPKRQRYGIRGHFYFKDPARVGDYVEVYKNRIGEVYTTPVSSHELLVALLLEKRDMARFRGKLEAGYRDYLHIFPHLRARVEGGELVSKVMACGPLAATSSQPFANGALLVGDAAGFLDPITGEGISLALGSAQLAAEIGARALERGDTSINMLASYGPARDKLVRHYMILTSSLLYLSQSAPLSRQVVKRLNRTPKLFQTLLGINCGHFEWRKFPWGELVRFLIGI